MKSVFSWLIILSVLAMVFFNIFTVTELISLSLFYAITISVLIVSLLSLIVVLIKERIKEKEEEKDVIGKY